MPDALGGEAGGEGIEAHDHAGRLGRLEGREARGHHVADGEILRTLESELQQFRIAQAGEREGANAIADEVLADEIPLIVDTAEVVGLHAAALGFFTGELEVIELHRALLQNGLGEDIEDAKFLNRVTNRAERDGGIQILKGKEALLLEVGGHLLEGGFQRFLKDGALVLLEGFLSYEECYDLALGDGHLRKSGDRLCVAEAAIESIVGDRELHLIPHEIDVSHHRLARNLKLHRHGGAVRMRVAADEIVNAQHAGHRRARMLLHAESARAAAFFRGGGQGQLGLTSQSDLRAGSEVSHGFVSGEFSRRRSHVHRPMRRHNDRLERHGRRS